MNKIKNVIIVICLMTVIGIVYYEKVVLKIDWAYIILSMSLSTLLSVVIVISLRIRKKKRKNN